MKSMIWQFFLSFVLLIHSVFCFDGPAVSLEAGNLTIKVLDTVAGTNLAGASVCYISGDTCSGAKGTTLNNGNFVFQNVPAGTITVKASKTGFLGRTLTLKMTSADLLQQIILQPGIGPGLICPQPPVVQVGNPTIQSVKINGGAASTTNLAVTLTITASGGEITEYRAAEPENGVTSTQILLQKPFIPIVCTAAGPTVTVNHTLILRRSPDNVRYGGRSVTVQVKSGPNVSNYKIDGIQLEPVLKDYTLTGIEQIQQVLNFAAANGFQHTLPTVIETCNSKCTGANAGKLETSPTGPCLNTVRGFFFQNRTLNSFWNIKQVADLKTTLPPLPGRPEDNVFGTPTISSSASETTADVFRIDFKVTLPKVLHIEGNQQTHTCPALGSTRFEKIVISGPEVDDFVDAANPWKNAFAQQ